MGRATKDAAPRFVLAHSSREQYLPCLRERRARQAAAHEQADTLHGLRRVRGRPWNYDEGHRGADSCRWDSIATSHGCSPAYLHTPLSSYIGADNGRLKLPSCSPFLFKRMPASSATDHLLQQRPLDSAQTDDASDSWLDLPQEPVCC